MHTIESVRILCSHITFSIFGQKLYLSILKDKKYGKRIYMQVFYHAPCTKTNNIEEWRGGKHYLSEHMTDDEIVRRAYVAFEFAVKHEIMEGFKFDDIIVFNPHVSFRKLLEISPIEIKRETTPNFDV